MHADIFVCLVDLHPWSQLMLERKKAELKTGCFGEAVVPYIYAGRKALAKMYMA